MPKLKYQGEQIGIGQKKQKGRIGGMTSLEEKNIKAN